MRQRLSPKCVPALGALFAARLVAQLLFGGYRPDGRRTAREAFVRIPGKHRNRDAAWDALEEILATRH
jgi:hypothetical protein